MSTFLTMPASSKVLAPSFGPVVALEAELAACTPAASLQPVSNLELTTIMYLPGGRLRGSRHRTAPRVAVQLLLADVPTVILRIHLSRRAAAVAEYSASSTFLPEVRFFQLIRRYSPGSYRPDLGANTVRRAEPELTASD